MLEDKSDQQSVSTLAQITTCSSEVRAAGVPGSTVATPSPSVIAHSGSVLIGVTGRTRYASQEACRLAVQILIAADEADTWNRVHAFSSPAGPRLRRPHGTAWPYIAETADGSWLNVAPGYQCVLMDGSGILRLSAYAARRVACALLAAVDRADTDRVARA